MEDSSFCWPDGSPYTYLNFAWPDWSPDSVVEPIDDDDDDGFFHLPATTAMTTTNSVTDASSSDGLSAMVFSHRTSANDAPSASNEQKPKQRPGPVAKPEAPPSFKRSRSSNISFRQAAPSSGSSSADDPEPDPEAMAQIKEMIYQAAAFRPVNFLPDETVVRPQRKNVRISTDPQTAAARRRREQVSERIRTLQKLVPGGTKMDTASMLDEAANYLKFLKAQVKALEKGRGHGETLFCPMPFILNPYMQNY